MKPSRKSFLSLVQREPFSVSAARRGDPSVIVERLTSGERLTGEERLFLAELAVKYVKRPPGAPPRVETFCRNEELQFCMMTQLRRGEDREKIVDDMGVEFGLSRSRIYEIIKSHFSEEWNSHDNKR